MNIERIERIIDFMKNVPESHFHFSKVYQKTNKNTCGYLKCIIGFIPDIFPEEDLVLKKMPFREDMMYVRKKKDKKNFDLEKFLDIPEEDFKALTEPCSNELFRDFDEKFHHINRNSTLVEILEMWNYYYNNY